MPSRIRASVATFVVAPAVVFGSAPTVLATAPPASSAAASTSTGLSAASNAWYTNWSGYQVAAAAPREARASWIVPKVSWAGRDGYSNMWVGLGGGNATQGQLIQAGTEHDNVCVSAVSGRCTASRSTYFMWLETYPQRTQEKITNLPIQPGDAVEATVRWQPTTRTAEFSLCNWRTNRCVTASRATSAPRGVAEFIVERPTNASGRQLALANFGSARFISSGVRDGSRYTNLGQSRTTRITMLSGAHAVLARPGIVSPAGDSFSVGYRRAA